MASFASSKPRLPSKESTRFRKQTRNSEASVRLEPRHVLQIVMYHVFPCIQHVQQIQAQRVHEFLGVAVNFRVPCPWSKSYCDYLSGRKTRERKTQTETKQKHKEHTRNKTQETTHKKNHTRNKHTRTQHNKKHKKTHMNKTQ